MSLVSLLLISSCEPSWKEAWGDYEAKDKVYQATRSDTDCEKLVAAFNKVVALYNAGEIKLNQFAPGTLQLKYEELKNTAHRNRRSRSSPSGLLDANT